MSTIEKLKRKLFEKPVRKFDEIGGGEND